MFAIFHLGVSAQTKEELVIVALMCQTWLFANKIYTYMIHSSVGHLQIRTERWGIVLKGWLQCCKKCDRIQIMPDFLRTMNGFLVSCTHNVRRLAWVLCWRIWRGNTAGPIPSISDVWMVFVWHLNSSIVLLTPFPLFEFSANSAEPEYARSC